MTSDHRLAGVHHTASQSHPLLLTKTGWDCQAQLPHPVTIPGSSNRASVKLSNAVKLKKESAVCDAL